MSANLTVYIIYNASTSVWGRISFGVRRLSTGGDGSSPCAAIDLTHGGLTAEEKPEWREAKKKIPAKIEQVHQDELSPELKKFVTSNHYSYPCIVGREANGPLKLLMTDYEIEESAVSYEKFLQKLQSNTTAAGLPWGE